MFGLTTTAGVYALIGFEVTPATLIGLLTIMGFSLYDTVIVFDKVQENTHGFEHTTRRTFAEQANLAINQTFMRSINTTLISITPVASLMIVAVWLLGVGTLKDLALVMLVGVVCGTYGSIFFATPLLVTLRERTEVVRAHTRRVLNRRKPAKNAEAGQDAEAGPDAEPDTVVASLAASPAPDKPVPGARPTASRTGRPSGKRNTRRR
jgi:preprotein translocase subunit SecF